MRLSGWMSSPPIGSGRSGDWTRFRGSASLAGEAADGPVDLKKNVQLRGW